MSKSKKGILLYRASIDGFNENDFNSRCYGKTDTITIIRNNLNYVFGVYTSEPWNISGGYINDPNSFLFSLRRNGKSYNQKYTRHQSSYVGSPFTFGFGSTHINFSNQLSVIAGSYINSVHLYNIPCSLDVNAKDFLTGNYNQCITTEIEVYQITVEHI